ncbi:peptidase T [Halobacillus litoralis]|uniref:peptidase T n=1 Tax=Halobacillus litoralis TaxID=45668 RepID=UPI001CD47177|nr:peptidase T [Halobacillus litoralis]MCA0971111.1 peptidase T [Halobacillus litoralis]
MKQELLDRFTSYVKLDTQSDEASTSTPSTEGQWELAHQLVEELKEIGLSDVTVDEHAYVMATLPSNTDKEVPVIGFLAHIDTATDFTGQNVRPQIVEDYDGGDIQLNEETVLSPADFPELSTYKGHTLVTTDGTTLLGADNKAGITEIMTALHHLASHPEIKHGDIRVAFTPDEEIGRGPHKFDVERFGASYAYTVDGGPLGELQYESFNAATAKVHFYGNSVHPGTAKDKMVNAVKLAIDFQNQLPAEEAPEHTEEYEGFFHLNSFEGNVDQANLVYLIRDHDKAKFAQKKELIQAVATQLKEKYGENRVAIELEDSYYNMGDKIEPVKHIVDIAYEAMKNESIDPLVKPIRGGTDGSQLSYMGLPTPNIFTGGENFHGKYEYVSVDNMEKSAKVIVEIARLFEEKAE